MSLSEGQVLDGKYVITRRIADGGTSTVYLGVNRRIGKNVAVKVLRSVVARDPDLLERFEREARIVSRIRSLHVADVYDFGELESGEKFMVMEYLEGESLATILERDHTIPSRILTTIVSQILDALAAAHAAGVVHRDLKPENVIVTTRGKGGRETVVKVVDFGISKIESATEGRMTVTAAGAVLGTPLYMSPEQARGNTDLVDQRTDLYSLGVIMYEAIAGQPPLTGDNVNALLFRVALEEPQPLTTKVPDVDPSLAAIVKKAMAKDVADRYANAEEMREEVELCRLYLAAAAAQPSSLGGVTASVVGPPALESFVASKALAIGTPPALVLANDARRTARHPRRARRLAVALSLFGVLLLCAPAMLRTALNDSRSPFALGTSGGGSDPVETTETAETKGIATASEEAPERPPTLALPPSRLPAIHVGSPEPVRLAPTSEMERPASPPTSPRSSLQRLRKGSPAATPSHESGAPSNVDSSDQKSEMTTDAGLLAPTPEASSAPPSSLDSLPETLDPSPEERDE